ncbi:MAG: CBS domain-containing protein [Chloroflexi bacterium]|nr:CBS domain-containing protein [Chloroflexota bacterium]
MKVSTILSTKRPGVITVNANQTIQEATMLLAENNIGALVVVNQGHAPVGILSERDIIRSLSQRADTLSLPVADIMTANVITGDPSDDLMSIAHTMTEHRFRHMPIVKDGELVGMISIGDILKTQRDQYRGERNTLETQILAE